jgi:hypothetical protein
MPLPVLQIPPGKARKFSTSARFRLDVTHTMPLDAGVGGVVDAWVEVEYSDDGDTWRNLRGLDKLYPKSDGTITVYDYEAPPARARGYRSYVMLQLNNGDIIPGDVSNLSIGVMYLKSCWVKDVFQPELNFTVPVDPKWLTIMRNKSKKASLPLGRTKPVVIGQKGSYESFTVKFTCLGDANWDRLQTLMEADRTLLFQTPRGQWYVQPVGSPTYDEDEFSLLEEPARIVTVDLLEVDPV